MVYRFFYGTSYYNGIWIVKSEENRIIIGIVIKIVTEIVTEMVTEIVTTYVNVNVIVTNIETKTKIGMVVDKNWNRN